MGLRSEKEIIELLNVLKANRIKQYDEFHSALKELSKKKETDLIENLIVSFYRDIRTIEAEIYILEWVLGKHEI